MIYMTSKCLQLS
uniref:Uncharacterized protein n=1 Tax=Arundo donax TaxID=35708 RepID=A0A0A9FKB4_ARUDO